MNMAQILYDLMNFLYLFTQTSKVSQDVVWRVADATHTA